MPFANAYDYIPKYNNSINYYGIGAYFAQNSVVIYQEPNEKSQVLVSFAWDNDKIVKTSDSEINIINSFITFLPNEKVTIFAVDDETEGWVQIVYDQKRALKGWVKISETAKFYYWRKILYKYAIKNGVYMWNDAPKESKALRTTPDKEKKPDTTFFYPKHIAFEFIKGNWMLVKVLDYDNSVKVGWIQWRTEDGKFLLYPAFRE